MKAVIYEKFGPPEVLKLREVEKPIPKDNEILVRVLASTVTSGAAFIRRGVHPDSRLFTLLLRLMLGIRKPKKSILGYELSGIVESAGNKVTRFKRGDSVIGTTTGLPQGAYAEYVCLPEEWKSGVVALKPENLNYTEAAAVPVGGMTALFLLDKADIQPGQSVLIYGASGSVGSFALQIAKIRGAHVSGVCSTSNREWVKELGADRVIDYTKEDFTQNSERYDVIFDTVSKIKKTQCRSSLKKNGRYITVNSPTKEITENLLLLKQWIEERKLKPVVDKCYSLEETADAHRYVDQGHKKGNVVITLEKKE